ncbi:MAG: 2-succinyl-5-enolpyruvyl-6-hydroxy-3-cyclohexene-1-carboxylic-acid synthase [Ardenticatenaceae bacterium]|nr:2-succinyl-5-enolpyruvyl-6-hydroxy-3-cyclohexene-1-carboxylic-acid synthase [Ardenticatenaceae bacterium]
MSINPSVLSASTLVASFAAAGLRHVCIAPGSRSTPLTLAFDAHPDIEVHLQLDERSAGFMALGLALKTGRPVALVCTSGTAAANFYPAVIEAQMSQVPLIVLTADRPPELRHSGANQTIDQVKMFGDHVLWAVDLDVPTAVMPEVARRNTATTATRAYQTANGLRKGPVHLNVPFRKPLEPQGVLSPESLVKSTVNSALSTQDSALLMPSRSQIELLVHLINRHDRGLIVCGPNCPDGEFPSAVAQLARISGYPIAADPLSGLRFGPWVEDTPIFTGYETILAGGRQPDAEPPEIVIRFGAVPTSKWLNQYLDAISPKVRLHVRASGVWADDGHRTTDFWQVDETALCQFVSSLVQTTDYRPQTTEGHANLPHVSYHASTAKLLQDDLKSWEVIDSFLLEANFDAAMVYQLIEQLPDESNLMIGNSLPIRHVDQFARPSTKRLNLFGNRGASGIDGIVSTAVGIAKADPERLTVLLVGDVSFFHDQNGLLPARDLPNFKIILLNNNSGSIFRRLPVSNLDPPFTALFLTPHDLNFQPIIEMHQLSYHQTADMTSFLTAIQKAFSTDGPAVVEYRSDGEQDEKMRQALVERVREVVGD